MTKMNVVSALITLLLAVGLAWEYWRLYRSVDDAEGFMGICDVDEPGAHEAASEPPLVVLGPDKPEE